MGLKIDRNSNKISKEITKELINRLDILITLGLGYLTLNRKVKLFRVEKVKE